MDVQPSLRFRSGFALIESLIAVFVLSVGLLGIAGLHMQTLKTTNDALNRTRAVFLAEDLIERIHANHGDVASYNWTITPVATPTTTFTGYTGSTQAENDKNHWASVLQNRNTGLPSGEAQVTVEPRPNTKDSFDVTIVVKWQEGAATEQLRLASVINNAT